MPYTIDNFKDEINQKLYSLKGKEQIEFAIDLFATEEFWDRQNQMAWDKYQAAHPDKEFSKKELQQLMMQEPQYKEAAQDCIHDFFSQTKNKQFDKQLFEERLQAMAELNVEKKVSAERKIREQVHEPHSAKWLNDYLMKNLPEGVYAKNFRLPNLHIVGMHADDRILEQMNEAYQEEFQTGKKAEAEEKSEVGNEAAAEEKSEAGAGNEAAAEEKSEAGVGNEAAAEEAMEPEGVCLAWYEKKLLKMENAIRDRLSDEDKALYDKANEYFAGPDESLDHEEQKRLQRAENPINETEMYDGLMKHSYQKVIQGQALDFVSDPQTVKNLMELSKDNMKKDGVALDNEKYESIAERMDHFNRQLLGSGKKEDSPEMAAVREQMNKVRELARSQGMNGGSEGKLKEAMNERKSACKNYMDNRKGFFRNGFRFTSSGRKRYAAVEELSSFLDDPKVELKDSEAEVKQSREEKKPKVEKADFKSLQKSIRDVEKNIHEKRRNSVPSAKSEIGKREHVDQKGRKTREKENRWAQPGGKSKNKDSTAKCYGR